MGFLTGLFWLAVVIIAAMAAGWVFRAAAIAVSPHGVAKEFRTMPLTAGFGLLMILIYVLVAILAPIIAPFPETEIVGANTRPGTACTFWAPTTSAGICCRG
jgi:peptide/nickel transport system permease protein